MLVSKVLSSLRPCHIQNKYSMLFSTQIRQKLQKYYKHNEKLKGYCTRKATQALIEVAAGQAIHRDNWKQPVNTQQSPYISSLGLGTMNGPPDEQHDFRMFQALNEGLKTYGINYIDTDINFRYGKSQKTVNAILNYLISQKNRKRQQFFISTKCGYIPNDIDSNCDEEKFMKLLLQQKIITNQQIVANVHCVSPKFLQFSLEKSRLCLGLQTIDLFFLNNFPDTQQPLIGQQAFQEKLKYAFEKMEQFRRDNKIRNYGLCSFVSFRSPPSQEGIYTSLQKIEQIASKVGGKNHGFRFISFPWNLAMPQGILKWQEFTNEKQLKVEQSIFTVAEKLGINIIACTSLFQGRVCNIPFSSQKLNNIHSIPAKHLQMARSLPRKNLISSLFGSNNQNHVRENLQILKYAKLTNNEWNEILPVDGQLD